MPGVGLGGPLLRPAGPRHRVRGHRTLRRAPRPAVPGAPRSPPVPRDLDRGPRRPAGVPPRRRPRLVGAGIPRGLPQPARPPVRHRFLTDSARGAPGVGLGAPSSTGGVAPVGCADIEPCVERRGPPFPALPEVHQFPETRIVDRDGRRRRTSSAPATGRRRNRSRSSAARWLAHPTPIPDRLRPGGNGVGLGAPSSAGRAVLSGPRTSNPSSSGTARGSRRSPTSASASPAGTKSTSSPRPGSWTETAGRHRTSSASESLGVFRSRLARPSNTDS